MKTRQTVLRLALWALTLPAAAVCTLAWAGPQNVPFKASVTSQETLGFDPVRCPATGLVGTTTGRGDASHLGAVTMLATDCPVLAPGVLPVFNDGMLTLNSASGDELRASYSGVLLPVAGSANLFTINGRFSVTGGSGRFLGASGSGYLQGSITLGPLVSQGQYEVTGQLSY